jgi:hypothetical protein
MANERSVLCGTASGARLPALPRPPLRLRIWERQPNVFFEIADVRDGLWAEVPDPFGDLFDIAAYVYCADQSFRRGSAKDEHFGAAWRRVLHFAVPVRLPDLWGRPDVREALTAALSFLSEDEYHFHFEPLASPRRFEAHLDFGTDRFGGAVEEVMLFSGGLDSLAGAVQRAVADRGQVLLVHHRSNPKTDPVLRRLVRELSLRARARPPIYLPVRINKERGMSREPTQRTRSFLYAALGATVSFMLGLDRVRFYENGVVSVNLPPSAQVVGARASRTTHPRALRRFGDLFSLLAGRRFTVENPFLWETKAALIRRIAAAECADMIGATRSCACPRGASNEQPHCGVCSQCIDRRFAVLAAGQEAHDPAGDYRADLLTGPRAPGPEQTMLAVYAQAAADVADMRPGEFFGRYGELSRVVGEVGESPEVAAQKVFELYRRHAREVNEVIEAGIAARRGEIRRRTLPPSCLLRMVYDEGEAGPAAPPAAAASPATPANVFRRKGQAWEVRFAGRTAFILLPSKGAAYLHLLLQQPGRPVSAARTAAGVAGDPAKFALGNAGDVADRDALTAYRADYQDHVEEMEKARKAGDEVLMGQLQKDMAALLDAIRKAQGLGGRPRKAGDDRDRVRKAVAIAVRRAVADIAKYDPGLAEHLSPPRLRYGRDLCYDPPASVAWET